MSVLPSRNNRAVPQLDGHGLVMRPLRMHDLARDGQAKGNPTRDDSRLRHQFAVAGRWIFGQRFKAAERFARDIGQAIWLRL